MKHRFNHTLKLLTTTVVLLTSISASAVETVELFPAKKAEWKQSGPGSFSIKEGVATAEGGMGLWWYSGKSFTDATFDIEVKLPDNKLNSGVFVRFPNPGNDPWVAVRKGYECQVSGAGFGKLDTGAIYDIQAPSHNTLKKAGEWNKYQITTWGNKIIIVINGELVNVYTTKVGRGDKQGYIGLQNHDPKSRVSYRKIEVREWKKELTLDEVLKNIGVTRADWAKYKAGRDPEAKWYQKMDLGPAWANMFEDHYQSKSRISTLKGLSLELSRHDSLRALFDTETLSMNSAFQGGIYWSGTPWTGSHDGLNRMANDKTTIMQNSRNPGWADKNGSFADSRPITGHGNLASDHGVFNGHFRHGSKVILDYTVLGSRVLELPSGEVVDGLPIFYRQMDLAASEHDRVLRVADNEGGGITISDSGKIAVITKAQSVDPSLRPQALPGKVSVVSDRTTGAWSELAMGAPSNRDLVDRSKNKKIYFRVLPGFLKTHSDGGDEEGVAVRLNDGLASQNDDDVERSFFFEDKAAGGRLEMNLGGVQNISRIHLFSNHNNSRSPQNVEIYGAMKDTAASSLKDEELEKSGWTLITKYNTSELGDGGKHGVAILSPEGGTLGSFHKLLFICRAGKKGNIMQTFFSEIDIYGEKAPALKPLASGIKAVGSYCVQVKGEGMKFADGDNGALILKIPASKKSSQLSLAYATDQKLEITKISKLLKTAILEPRELESLTKGGAALYPDVVEVKSSLGNDKKTWIVDTIGLPVNNPWFAKIKPGGLGLFSDGDSAALSTWNGDVWIVRGLKGDWKKVQWRRFATGLYEPLGLQVVDDVVYVNGRDQITRLHDQNNDGEADWYECFNNDVYVTKNFHEFTFGLQTDKEGNFYISKGAPVLGGGRGFDKIVPHNGTLLKVSKDGKKMEVIATGLRAPGGIGVGPNGEMTSGENEGTWQPCCKLNYFTGKDKFLGVEDTAQHLKGQKMDLPLCYFPMRIDNSGGGQAWVPEGVNWGLKSGELIHLSYGKSTIYRVLRQEVEGTIQGGVVRIPVKLNSSAMRGRFHQDGSLYTLGFRGWQTNASTEQAFHRIRYTGKDVTIPDKLEVTEKGIYIRFEKKLDASTVTDRFNFKVERWKYIRSSMYGSGEFSIDNPDVEAEKQATIQESQKYRKHDQVQVAKSVLLPDGKTVFLVISNMKPAEQMSIRYTLKFADASKAEGEIVNTVHKLGKHKDDAIAKFKDKGNAKLENLKPGLHQAITQGGKTDHRVSRLAAQYNSNTDAVSDMLGKNQGRYTSKWSGYLILKERKDVEFSLQGTGVAELKIDGKNVLSENGDFGSKTSDTLQLDPGAHRLELDYKGAADGSGHVRFMWKGKDFPKQSIPSSFFKHQETKDLSKSISFRHGRDIVAEQNCTSCHSADEKLAFPEAAYRGPSMQSIGSRVSEKWLAQWLSSPHSVKPSTTMPAIVDGNTEQGRKDAADMAAYLASLNSKKSTAVEVKSGDVKHGGARFHTLGCIACHSLPSELYDVKTGRMALNRVSEKYSQSALTAFLKKPDANHASIKMPDFGLSDEEARQLAAFLRSESDGKAPASKVFPKGDAVRGAELLVSQNCALCHSDLPNNNVKLPSFQSILSKSWNDHGCVIAKTPGKTPVLNITDDERVLLENFRSHYAKEAVVTLNVSSSHDFAQRQVKALNCTACHQRDELPSLLESLHSQSQHLTEGVPEDDHHKIDQSRPSLTYIGEMLHSDYMQEVLDGKLKQSPRPWLSMRMPAYHSRAEILTKGLAGQHGMAPSKVDVTNLDAEKIKVGKKLVGANGGFACNICHGVGAIKPLAAFEVEGINFDQVAHRLRPGYYHKWMENPQSITPTTKMPRYTTSNKSPFPVYDKDAEKQFDAVMEYLKSLK